MEKGRQEDREVSSCQTLRFARQRNGRLVAPWGDDLVGLDTIKLAGAIRCGEPVEMKILERRRGDRIVLTAQPTSATQRALEAAGTWTAGNTMMLSLIFRARDGGGVVAVEPFTGKNVYPAEGTRVWVNDQCEYLCEERGPVVFARPVEEEKERKARDPENPSEPYTYDQPWRSGRRSGGGRRSRPAAPPLGNKILTVTFQPNQREGKDGVVAFSEEIGGGKRPIFPRNGATVPIGVPVEVFFRKTNRGVMIAEPVKSPEDLHSTLPAGTRFHVAPSFKRREEEEVGDEPIDEDDIVEKEEAEVTSTEEAPLSGAARFEKRHGTASPPAATSSGPVVEHRRPATVHQPRPTFAAQIGQLCSGAGSKGE
jgi:hypothetical protein